MGLEYVLSKGRETSIAKLVNELFNPKQSLGKEEFEALTSEEKLSFYETGALIPYLNPVVSRLN
jgi:hypothetical protein